MNTRKFTFKEVTSLLGRLQLFSMTYYCEIGEHNNPADMTVVTQGGIPIFVCLECATKLVGESRKAQLPTTNAMAHKANGTARRSRKAVR